MVHQPLAGQSLSIIEAGRLQPVNTRDTRWDSSGQVISATQIHLPHTTQDSQYADIHGRSAIQTRNLSKQEAVVPRLRPHHGHGVRRQKDIYLLI